MRNVFQTFANIRTDQIILETTEAIHILVGSL